MYRQEMIALPEDVSWNTISMSSSIGEPIQLATSGGGGGFALDLSRQSSSTQFDELASIGGPTRGTQQQQTGVSDARIDFKKLKIKLDFFGFLIFFFKFSFHGRIYWCTKCVVWSRWDNGPNYAVYVRRR